MRIVEHARPPLRGLYALLYGAGVEVSAALACTERHVDRARHEVRAPGTKSRTRDRVVRVAEWAWPYLETHLDALTPGERLFRGLDRFAVRRAHTAALVALEIPHHRVHDARHFYAVRAVRAGTPYGLVARQLGHADIQMVARIYGKYAPRSDERDRWELIAAPQDRQALPAPLPSRIAKKSRALGTAVGTSLAAPKKPEVANSLGISDFE